MGNSTVEAVEYTDHFKDKPHRKIYTYKELDCPGISVIGQYHSYSLRSTGSSHFHRDCIEIRLIINGNSFIAANGKEYHLRGGDIFLTPANLPHTSRMAVCEMYWIQILIGKPSFLFLDNNCAAELQNLLGSLQARIYRGVDFSRKYLAEMFSLLTSDSVICKHQGCSQLVNILYRIIAAKPETQDPPSADIQKAINYIGANIHEEITLDDLAAEAFLSLSHFMKKFQEQIGMPPRMFINIQKIEAAKKLLSEGRPITVTAFDLGFKSSAYFSTVFRKFTRMTPGEFVKKFQQQTD